MAAITATSNRGPCGFFRSRSTFAFYAVRVEESIVENFLTPRLSTLRKTAGVRRHQVGIEITKAIQHLDCR